ncbi:MAG: PilZ domain-containing protein [Hyphomicrobiaceae bacterium]
MSENTRRMTSASSGPHNRRSERNHILLPGQVGIPGYRLSVPCKVLNVSASGVCAMLFDTSTRVQSAAHLPDEILLMFTMDRVEVIGEIRWREASRFGIKFLSSFRTIKRADC